MAAGESPKVTLSSPSQYSGLRLRCGMRIRELPEEHELLRRWCEGLDQEYRGQRLAGLAHEVFLKLLKAKREVPTAAQRQEVLAVQQGLCALCGCTVTQSACKLDHVVPVRQLFADSVQRLQALCVDSIARRRSGNPRSPRVWRAASARGLWRPTCAVRSCRRWSSRPRGATARSPTWVSTSCAVAATVWPTHPSRCPSFAPRTAWSPWSRGGCRTWATCRDARASGRAAAAAVCGPWLVPQSFHCRDAGDGRVPLGWPEGEEHMAKLSVNAMIGLWARRADVIYSVRSSSCQLDGPGADFTQSFCYGEGSVWHFVYTRRLLTNGTYRPIHDAVLGFERCMVAKARRLLQDGTRLSGGGV